MFHKRSFRLLVGLLALLGLALVFRVPAEIAGRIEPVTGSRPDFGSRVVVVAADQRIFTLYAALNAAGYDGEASGLEMHPVRQLVRAALAGRDLPSLARLRPIFDSVADYHLVSWVLQRGEQPPFLRAQAGWWVSTRAADVDGLADALAAFHREADIAGLWSDAAPAHRAAVDHAQPLAEGSLAAVQAYLRTEAVPFRQLVVVPNLLDAYYSGTGPQIGDIAYVIAGPTETDLSQSGLIEHEALHSFIGPMLDRRMGQIPVDTSRRLYAVLQETMPEGYGTWESVFEESLIRAINTRMLDDDRLRAAQLDGLQAGGFLLSEPLDQALAAYEASGLAFEDYLPVLLSALDAIELSADEQPDLEVQ